MLHWAARNGRLDVCKWCVYEKGVDVDVGTDDGTTPLHFATYNGQLETCRWLVQYGCDINKENSYGCNASQWCALHGSVELMVFFKGAGLDFKSLNLNGHSALHKCAIKGNREACKWLLTCEGEGGGGLDESHMQADRDGFTPQMFASENGFPELAMLISEYSAKLG